MKLLKISAKHDLNHGHVLLIFLNRFAPGDIILDIGCGNGKNMSIKSDLKFKGIDLSDKLVQICKTKGLDVIEGTMVSIPFDNESFDGIIAVAS
jgi:ubiquinone/menaquinone biosynthesis C-methylase UbiE